MMMMRSMIFATTATFALCVNTSTEAEPGPSIQSLMKEKASVFDVGMLRLQLFLQGEQDRDEKQTAVRTVYNGPWYSYADNRLEIYIRAYFDESLPSKLEPWQVQGSFDGDWQERCAYQVTSFKNRVWIRDDYEPPWKRDLPPPSASKIRGFFEHIGYSLNTQSQDRAREIDNITRINVSVFEEFLIKTNETTGKVTTTGNPLQPKHKCNSMLMSTKVLHESSSKE